MIGNARKGKDGIFDYKSFSELQGFLSPVKT